MVAPDDGKRHERAPKTYRNRQIIVWQPDVGQIRNYLRAGDVPARLAELLRTVPTVNLERYEPTLGIRLISIEGAAKPSTATTVAIGEDIEVPYEARDKTVYILGRPGMGKSSLLVSMSRQDILNGKGVGVIDPHGDLIRDLLPHIPRNRVKDVILFDAVDLPIGINLFSVTTPCEKEIVVADVVTLFARLLNITGDRMDAILTQAVRTLVEWPEATFLDIYWFLKDDYFRDTVVRSINNRQTLVEFWREDYPKYPHPATEQPILTRMSKFAMSPTLELITGSRSPFNVFEAMQSRKIVLCSIPKWKIGDEESAVLGALLVSQFHLAAMRRGNLPPKQRTPFYLYIDEFQNFKTSAFNEIITEARKFQLCLTLANQKLGDLDDATRSAVQGAETSVYFRPFDEDAGKVARVLTSCSAAELLDLDQWHAVVRQGKVSNSAKIVVEPPPAPPKGYVEEIIANTKANFPSVMTARNARGKKGEPPRGGDVEPGPPPEDDL